MEKAFVSPTFGVCTTYSSPVSNKAIPPILHTPVSGSIASVASSPSATLSTSSSRNIVVIPNSHTISQKDEATTPSPFPNTHSSTVLISKENACEDIENALDNLVDQLQNAWSLTHNYYQKMVNFLKSRDVLERLEATHVFRKSLSEQSSGRTSSGSTTHVKNGHLNMSDPLVNFQRKNMFPHASGTALSSTRPSLRHPNFSASPLSSSSSPSPTCYGSNQHLEAFPPYFDAPTVDVSIQDLIDAGVVPHIVNALCYSSHLHLMLESVLLLAKLVSGTTQQTRAVVTETNLIAGLINLLREYKHNCPIEFRNAIFTVLRNIALDSEELRDMILHFSGSVTHIVENARLSSDVIALRLCYVIAFAHKVPPYSEISPIAEFLADCIRESDDPQILSIACQGFVNICDNAANVENMINLNILGDMICLMKHSSSVIVFDALSVIAKVAYSGSNAQINQLVEYQAVPLLAEILKNASISQSATRSRACNVLGNIGCETPHEVQAVIDTNVFPLLVNIFRFDPDYNTRVEAAYAVCAAASKADCAQVGYIVSCTSRSWGEEITTDNNCMQLIADMLELVSESDPTNPSNLKLCRAILRGLDNILNRGSEEGKKHGLWENPYAFLFKSVQGHSKLAQMQFFPEYTVVRKTNEILEKYFYVTSGFLIHN